MFKKIYEKIDELRENVSIKLNGKADREFVRSEIDDKFKIYVECHKCGNLVNEQKAQPLPVLRKDLDENVLDYYVLQYSYNALKGENKEINSAKTIYFCQHCKKEYPKKDKQNGMFKV
jgi:DNA-directed RNA polymerase subunit RPC12/RpoP